jgi:hypothetical protein
MRSKRIQIQPFRTAQPAPPRSESRPESARSIQVSWLIQVSWPDLVHSTRSKSLLVHKAPSLCLLQIWPASVPLHTPIRSSHDDHSLPQDHRSQVNYLKRVRGYRAWAGGALQHPRVAAVLCGFNSCCLPRVVLCWALAWSAWRAPVAACVEARVWQFVQHHQILRIDYTAKKLYIQ